MKAIILGAGIGQRMREFNKSNIPKVLLEIDGKSILEHKISVLRKCGIEDIYVVIGKYGDCWGKSVLAKIKKMHNQIIINEKNLETHSPYSLHLALNMIEADDIISIDGDLIFSDILLNDFMRDKRKNLVLARHSESRYIMDQGSKFFVDGNDKVVASLNNINSNLLFCGLFKIRKSDLELLKKILQKKSSWNRQLYYPLHEFSRRADLRSMLVNTYANDVKPGPILDYNLVGEKQDIEMTDDIVTKKAFRNSKRLRDEIYWIESVPVKYKNKFPEIIDYEIKPGSTTLRMKEYHCGNLADKIINHELPISCLKRAISNVTTFMFDNIYSLNVQQTPVGFFRKAYFGKVIDRVEASRNKNKLFDMLVDAKKIRVNSVVYENPLNLIKRESSDSHFLSTLEPPHIAMFHGDFKPDNILYDFEKNDFVLVDPRGRSSFGSVESDYLEDSAKMLTSLENYYDLMVRGYCGYNMKEIKDIISFKLIFGSQYKLFRRLARSYRKLITTLIDEKKDPFWEKRMSFIQASLLLSNAPFQLVGEGCVQIAIIEYLQGTILLNQLINKYSVGEAKKYYLVNINTSKDYFNAKSFIAN